MYFSNIIKNARFMSNIKIKLDKDYTILGMDFPSSRFNKPIKNKTKLTEYEKICGLDFPNSRFEKYKNK